MNKELYEISKKELEKAKEQNNEQISISDERTRMAKINRLEYKGIITLYFSLIAYILLFITSIVLPKALNFNITNILPGYTYSLALAGGSIGIGSITKALFQKKFQTKKRLENFSTAKTQAEKLEEEIHYEIELKKANNRNRAIDKTIEVLNSNQTIVNKMSSEYDLNDKLAPKKKEEALENIKNLTTVIKDKYEQLDILTTQKVLHDRFWRIRDNFQRGADIAMVSMMSVIPAVFFSGFPTLMNSFNTSISAVFKGALAIPFISSIISVAGSSAYMLKRNKDYKKVFNHFNSQLGENALEENLDKKYESPIEEQKEIEDLIDRQIIDISLAEIHLQENKIYLDTYTKEDETKEDILSRDFPELHMVEEMKKDVLEHPDKYTNCDVRTRTGMFYTDEERKRYIDESSNIPSPDEKEKGPTLVKKKKTK